MKILFTGDVNFRGIEPLDGKKSTEIISELLPYLSSADFRILNLEAPLADKENHTPIEKSGPNLICDPSSIIFLKKFGADGVTLANNHIGDFGEGAVKNTLDVLDEGGILHAGAGANVSQAYEAMHFEKSGVRVAVISVCENEFGMATKKTFGSAGYEPRRLLKQIQEERSKADFVTVVFHGGNEFCPLPSPDTVERYRLICDMGADAVIGGHTHCPQGYEYYGGKPIVYSIGNLLFTSQNKPDPNDSWYYGYAVILNIEESLSLELVPYKYDKKATKIHVFGGEDKEKMLEYIEHISEIIQDEEELCKHFKGWAWHHPWIPTPPKDLEKLEVYRLCANMNLLFCEAHHSQSKAVFEALYKKETALVRQYEAKIKALQKMPTLSDEQEMRYEN